jgi:hypothetical protein
LLISSTARGLGITELEVEETAGPPRNNACVGGGALGVHVQNISNAEIAVREPRHGEVFGLYVYDVRREGDLRKDVFMFASECSRIHMHVHLIASSVKDSFGVILSTHALKICILYILIVPAALPARWCRAPLVSSTPLGSAR